MDTHVIICTHTLLTLKYNVNWQHVFVEASTSGLCQTRLTEVSKSPTDMTGRLTAVEWVVQDRGLMNSVEDSSCVDLFIIVLSFTKQWSGTSFANPQTSEHVV